jgi:hypothetical protein
VLHDHAAQPEANVTPSAGARVGAGVLYRITCDDAERLDRTEGVPQGMDRRVDVDVLVDGAARVRAFTYQSALGESGRPGSNRRRPAWEAETGQSEEPASVIAFSMFSVN